MCSARIFRLGLVLSVAAATGCAPSERDGASLALAGGARTAAAASGSELRMRLDPDGSAAWVDHEISPTAWRTSALSVQSAPPDTWSAPRPDGIGFMKSGEQLALGSAGERFTNQPDIHSPADLAGLLPGSFAGLGELLHLRLASGKRPESALVFSVRKERHLDARPALGGWTGDGFALWPGEAMTFRMDVAAERALRFYWSLEGLAGRAPTRTELRVTLDGEPLATLEQTADSTGSGQWCRVELPAAGRDGATLAFALAGEPSLTAVLAPRLGPARPPAAPDGTSGGAPDLILFLADTFRADNLAHGGGPGGLAPELDRLAAASLRFTAARSPSTWTLPSQASLLTGLYPEQHGATSLGRALASELTTLPELLAAHGYRTGAVTDSAFVSRHYGFDQGFEWFQEFRSWNLTATLRAALEFLAADDGRPTFLFVQTYRTHMPYRTGADESRGELETLVAELKRGCLAHGGDGSIPPREAGTRMLAAYHAGVAALDAQFGPWWRAVEERGTRPTFLAFTSDHGEAFLEHGEIGHGGSPWEEKIRIPLFLSGPGLTPRAVAHKTSLVDLPPTFCALSGIPAPQSWEGRNLIDLDEERTAYSFVRIAEEPMVAVIDGTRKFYSPADPARMSAGEVRLAVDLAADPGESTNDAANASWPAQLARAQAAAIARLVEAQADPRKVELSAEDRAFLDDIGYGGD